MRIKFQLCAVVLIALFMVSGCVAKDETVLTPDNMLQKAYGKSEEEFCDVFEMDLKVDAETNSNGGWYITKPVVLFGREVDRLYLNFSAGKLSGFDYAFAFANFDDAFDFAQILAQSYEKKYGKSILEDEYGQQDVPHLAARNADDLLLKWERSDEKINTTKEAYSVSDDCVLEITFTSFEMKSYLVTLSYKYPGWRDVRMNP